MKLYARVTSERASKGQGGNEYLIIDLTVEDRGRYESVGEVELIYNDDHRRHGSDLDEWVLQYRPHEEDEWVIIAQGHVQPKIKSKKQEGE